MSRNQNPYCGCKVLLPAPRDYKNCTKTPNSHLPCVHLTNPVADSEYCGRTDLTPDQHNPENIQPGSSRRKATGNCPNHRSDRVWFEKDGNGFWHKRQPMATGFIPPPDVTNRTFGGGRGGNGGNGYGRTHSSTHSNGSRESKGHTPSQPHSQQSRKPKPKSHSFWG